MASEMMSNNARRNERRGVAPIIATLLMVAIAVVGGILIFVFAQGFFSTSQVEGPVIESLSLVGYDAREILNSTGLENHAGTVVVNTGDGSVTDSRKGVHDDIVLYFKNTGTQDLVVSTLKLGGETLVLDTTVVSSSNPTAGEYLILEGNSDGTPVAEVRGSPTLTAGQETSVIVSVIDSPLKVGRNTSVELTTGNGAVFKFEVLIGVQKGGF